MIPLLLLGAVLAFALSSKKAGASDGASPVAPSGGQYSDCTDPGMSPLDVQIVSALLTEGNADILRAASKAAAGQGFPKAAKCLENRANAAALEVNTGRRRPALAAPPSIGKTDSTTAYVWGR